MPVRGAVNSTTAIPWRRSRTKLTPMEKLRCCQEAWSPSAPWDREAAHDALKGTPAGSFLVVRDAVTSQAAWLCVSAGPEGSEVLDYSIQCKGTDFQLSESCLTFSDLKELVFFYSLTRDVLALPLSIPHWIFSVSSKDQCLSQLQPETWLSPSSDQQTNEVAQMEPSTVMCSIQLTSSSGALCVINPLYVHEHGDDFLASRPSDPPSYRREPRLSSTRAWAGAGLMSKRATSLDQESLADKVESAGLIRARSADAPNTSSALLKGVILRNPSQDSLSSSSSSSTDRSSSESLSPSSLSAPICLGALAPEGQQLGSSAPQSPHRVSWIEDGVWLPPPRRASSLHPSAELDSLSISSVDEEQDSRPSSPAPHHPSAQGLANKVKYRLSTVGQALGGLVCPKKKLANRVLELSERKGGAFSEAVRKFSEAVLKRRSSLGRAAAGTEFLQEVRSSLTALRETLLDQPEVLILLDGFADMSDGELDMLLEVSLHKVALKPLSNYLYSCIHASRSSDGSLKRLQANQRVLEESGVGSLGGSEGVGVPDAVVLERIQQRWTSMHEAYSPNKKVQILLKVCKSIYHSMSANSSSVEVFGADDFLPCLTWVLLRSDVVNLQVDTDYMMELLDPTQLKGEGGYYLTTLYASLYYISSFQPRVAARQLSVEAQHTINQWHRRRTLHGVQSRISAHRRTIRRTGHGTVGHKGTAWAAEMESGHQEGGGELLQQQKQAEGDTVGVSRSTTVGEGDEGFGGRQEEAERT